MKTKLYLLCGLLCDATVWTHQLAAFQTAYDVETVDFHGFDSLTAMAEHLLARSSGPFALAGHSMGARVALEAYRLAPGRITRLALLDTGIHPLKDGETEKRLALVENVRRHGMDYLTEHWLLPMLAEPHRRQPEIVQPLADMVRKVRFDDFAAQIQALINRPDAAAALRQVHCPLLLGVGEFDDWSPVAQHRHMQQLVPHAHLAVFPQAGHMAPFEAPEAVTAALQDWLAA